MSAARVLSFRATTPDTPSSPRPEQDQVTFRVGPREGEAEERLLGASDLYPTLDREDSYAGAALRVLAEILQSLNDADNPENGYIESDTCLMKARIQLSKAFTYRDALGEGYAAVINAANWALANSATEALPRRKIRALSQAMERLRSSPYMHFDSAMSLMDDLESEGFDIDPAALDNLLVEDDA